MKKQKINHKPNVTNFVLIAIIVILLCFTAKYIWLPIIQNTSLYNQVCKIYQDNKWITFTSERAKFSFKHPLSWPVTPATDEQLVGSNILAEGEYRQIESIDFEEEWVANAGGPRLGFISVERVKDVYTLDDYVKTIDKELPLYVKGRTIMIPPPKIEYLTIGGERAISVSENSGVANLSPSGYDYRLVKNGLLYRFSTSLSSRYLEDKDKNNETFQKMMASVKFID